MPKEDVFTGYISLSGHHVKDGLKQRPVAFQEDGDDIVLRWIKLKEDGRFYEHEERFAKDEAVFKSFNIMSTGIEALNQFHIWLANQHLPTPT